jgi:signal peptidase I
MTSINCRRIGKWLTGLLLTLALILITSAVMILIVIPRAMHGTVLTVRTGSMTPRLSVGSVVIDRPVEVGRLRVGDIATYQKAPGVAEYITHRIVAINPKTTPETFTFKGDANRGPDVNPIPATAIRGQVWLHVPYLGSVRESLRTGSLRGLILALAVLSLAAYAVVQVVDVARKRMGGRPAKAAHRQGSARDAGPAPDVSELSRG